MPLPDRFYGSTVCFNSFDPLFFRTVKTRKDNSCGSIGTTFSHPNEQRRLFRTIESSIRPYADLLRIPW